MKNDFNEKGILKGKYSLKIENKNAEPEEFLDIFQNTPYYNDIRKFVRRIDNDTGIPYLKIKEYEKAKKIIPSKILNYFEEGTISYFNNKVYLRNKNYYLNYQQQNKQDKKPYPIFALELLKNNIEDILELKKIIHKEINKSQTLEERMIIGSLLDMYKNHTMILFTGLYESMKEDSTISINHYNSLRKEIEIGINNYYQFIIKKRTPTSFMDLNNFIPIFNNIENVIHRSEKRKKILLAKNNNPISIIGIYDNEKYLSREFDHPGRMILYASHLLSQINKPYDLLINILNGSAEIGLGIQTIDNILKTNCIRDSIIYDVDFARYSMKDRKQKEIPNYFKFEKIAIPNQLRKIFRQKIENKDLLVIDDNLSTGQSLYNVEKALNEIANSVDISVVETLPNSKVIKIKKRKKQIKLRETDLTYPSIGEWRYSKKLNKNIKKILGLY